SRRNAGTTYAKSLVAEPSLPASRYERNNPRRMNQPTPDPSLEGSRGSSASCRFPSWEGLGVGSRSQRYIERRTRPPTPDPSLEGNRLTASKSRLPSREGLGLGSWSGCRSRWNRQPPTKLAAAEVRRPFCFWVLSVGFQSEPPHVGCYGRSSG